jgi:cobyrinic acid a,c-diamide synthase
MSEPRRGSSSELGVRTASGTPRIVVAGASSNVGKTTIAAGLIASLRQRGLVVQPFKCGPDYVDPSYHQRAAGRPCRNLDTWMLSDTQLLESFARACHDADIAVIEGVMGLYDGSDWLDERGSTAQIAKVLDASVLLVVDISGSARSAAAVVLGYQSFDPAVSLCGVALNFAGSERHAKGCGEAIMHATRLPLFGWLPRELKLRVPERHLGLVPGGEQVDSEALIAEMAAAVTERFDIDGLIEVAAMSARDRVPGRPAHRQELAGKLPPDLDPVDTGSASAAGVPDVTPARAPPPPRRISPPPVVAVARDDAFCFYYPENLELLVEEGAAVEFFSPLRGERPGAHAAGVYLGGGYPELHGPALASNIGLWSALKDLHAAEVPIYAECGGFMVLTEGLVDAAGRSWPMAGLLPGVARMSAKLAALGYRYATALQSNLLVDRGVTLRGHEFRYSSWVCDSSSADTNTAWQVRGTRPEAPVDFVGYSQGNLLASYLHVHFGQRRELARRFVQRLKSTAS